MSFFTSDRLVCISSFVACASALCAPGALAQNAEIDDDRTSAVDSADLLGEGGTLTITEDGSVTVSSGTALSITGNHSLLMQGTLESEDATNAVGLGVYTDDLRLTSTIDIEGAFVINGIDDTDGPSNNIGFGVFGNGIFDGDITLDSGSSFSVHGGTSKGFYLESALEGNFYSDATFSMAGPGAIGIDLGGPIEGDVVIDGSINSRNEDGIGIRQSGRIDGAFVHQGSIGVGVSATSNDDADVDAIPGKAGIYLTEDITGGVLLGGACNDYNTDTDSDGDGNADVVPASAISSVGGAPGLLIENLKTDGSDLVIGLVGDTGYGLVHRGSISVAGSSAGLDAAGIRLLGGEDGARTVIEGGIHIDDGQISVTAFDGAATGLDIGDGVDTERLFNQGTIQATTSVSYNDDGNEEYSVGGDAVGINIAESATLEVLDNEGSIAVAASGEDVASIAILDKSGTLREVYNSGVLYAARGTNNYGDALALDARANTVGLTFVNEGSVIGDVLLGSGDDEVSLTDGSFDGDIDFGAGDNIFRMSGDAEFYGSVTHSGSLDFYLSGADLSLGSDDTFRVTNAYLSDDAHLFFSIDPVEQQAGQIIVDGDITLSGDTRVTAVFDTIVTEEQTYEVIDAGSLSLNGTLAVDDQAFLMVSTLSMGDVDDSLYLTVRPKTAEELEFTGNRATLYENLLTSLEPEDDVAGSLANLGNADVVEEAMQSLMPDTTNASFQMTYSAVRQLEAGLNDRMIELSASKRLEGGFWAREALGYGNMTGTTSEQKVDYLGAGILMGYDAAISNNFLWGFGGGFLLQGASRDSEIGDDVSIFSPYLSTYAIAKAGRAFASASASLWYNSINRDRELSFGVLDKGIESTTQGYTASLDTTLGYDLKLGGLHVRPKLAASYIRSHEGGYTEEGGDGANLIVDGRTFSRLDGSGRVDVGYDIKWNAKGTVIRPEVFAIYRKKLAGSDADTLTASFASGGDSFTLDTDAIAEKSYEFGGALNVFGGFGTASFRYSYEKREEWKAHYAGVNFKMPF
jgi:outer membrane autotransporter protein